MSQTFHPSDLESSSETEEEVKKVTYDFALRATSSSTCRFF
jgi:hypothetical protein